MGLVGMLAALDKKPPVDFRFTLIVQSHLKMLDEFLGDAQSFQERYGGERAPECMSDTTQRATCLSAVFDKFPIAPVQGKLISTFKKRSRWLIRDAKKFKGLVDEIGSLVAALQGLTKMLVPVETQTQTSMLISKIEAIKDVESLDLISEAC